MAKISMVEYQGRCDRDGKAVGHGPKVLKEYYNFIEKNNDVKIYAPQVIIDSLKASSVADQSGNSDDGSSTISLGSDLGAGSSNRDYDISLLSEQIVMTSGKSFFKRLSEKMGMFKNIKAAVKNNDSDYIWFFNVEYYLMLYIFLHKKIRSKVICTFFLDGYHNGFVGKVKQWVFEKAQKKIDLIIATGPNLKFKNCKTVYVPDYYYIPDKYDALRNNPKEEKAVCLGTMNSGKQLEDMVEAFNRTGYPLYIAGRFFDKDRCQRLKNMAADNVTIEDRYLSDKEYLDIISKAKYTVLPYNPTQYNRQTSGVMQEAVFTGSIVVTYDDILKGNKVPGIGFSSWSELSEDMLKKAEAAGVTEEYNKLINSVFSFDSVKEKYNEIFS